MLLDRSLRDFLEELSAGTPAPAAGTTAALAGAMAAALVGMVCRVTLGSDRYADAWEAIRGPLADSDALRAELASLAEEDIRAYGAFGRALLLPRQTEAQKEARRKAIQAELRRATEVPLEIARKCRAVLETALPAAAHGAPMAVADIGTAAHLAEAGRKGAFISIRANLLSIKDPDYIRQVEQEMERLGSETPDLRRRVLLLVESRMK